MTLRDWIGEFDNFDSSPWPGPRPMEINDPERWLVGRDAESDAFFSAVQGHRLTVLTGESGVGKTSLLNTKLMHDLRNAGFEPMVCERWVPKTGVARHPEAIVAARLYDTGRLPPGVEIDEHGQGGLCEQLDELYGGRAVIVLDQFEELIRHDPELFNKVSEWVSRVNLRHEIRMVLSLRVEYAHRLRWIETHTRPFSMTTYNLESLAMAEAIKDIVGSAVDPDGGGSIADIIDADAGALLEPLWRTATREAQRVVYGPLHFQAVLYSLYHRSSGPISTKDVRELIGDSAHPFGAGISEAVRIKLDNCSQACVSETVSCDPHLIAGTREMVRRVLPHLSSGSFKLEREQWDLARLTLDRQLSILGVARDGSLSPDGGYVSARWYTDDVGRRLFDGLAASASGVEGMSEQPQSAELRRDLLTISRSEIDPDETTTNLLPWVADPDETSSGPMLGMRPRSVLIEELRRFVFALQWLIHSQLVRQTEVAPGETWLSFVHDGFGAALDEWADRADVGCYEAASRLTATRGEYFQWSSAGGTQSRKGESIVANVRWRDCQISAEFRQLTFINCDFRGTRFDHCAFEGVVFVNCLLDGATFDGCEILGSAGRDTAGEQAEKLPGSKDRSMDAVDGDRPPSFVISDAGDIVAALSRYRELDIGRDATELYSDTSGLPALPKRSTDQQTAYWGTHAGGLTMYGGRLCSLMVKNCSFDTDGTMSFRNISGTALDIVEQPAGKFEIIGGAVRGLSVTSAVDTDNEPAGSLVLTVVDSILSNTWFGDRLRGSATFEKCKLYQMWNSGDTPSGDEEDSFRFVFENCYYQGLVNVGVPGKGSEELLGFQLDGIDDRAEMLDETMRMDYRSNPARYEVERRQRLADA